jgi:hypothetical protein
MYGDPSLKSKKQRLAHRVRSTIAPLLTAAALAVSFVSLAPAAHAAGPRAVAEAFAATTANMTPAGVNLRIQVIEWQEADARSEAVATLVAGADAATPLSKLPTVGYVWPSDSPVGYSLKYSHRVAAADGGERITLVTDKPLGSYDYKGWSVANATATHAPYSVIELELPGSGAGTGSLSLAGEVTLDEQAGTVTLAAAPGGASLLTNVKREPAAR